MIQSGERGKISLSGKRKTVSFNLYTHNATLPKRQEAICIAFNHRRPIQPVAGDIVTLEITSKGAGCDPVSVEKEARRREL